MYGKLSRFVERQITIVGSAVVIGALLLWFVSELVPSVKTFIVGGAFFDVVLVVLLFEILHQVIDLKIGGRPAGAQVSVNQDEAWPTLQEFVRSHRPKSVDMIEYS